MTNYLLLNKKQIRVIMLAVTFSWHDHC